jgi:hypothetical protein
MISRSRGRAQLPIARALFVLAALALAPSSAEASCGHGVTSRVGRSLSDLTILSDSAGTRSDPMPSGSRGDRPCSGPSCSRGQGLPDAPTLSIYPRREHWCLTAPPLPPTGAEPVGGPIADDSPHPRFFTSVPERPPRSHQAARSS